jgi:ATP-binding cassette subfamily B protein
MKKFPYFPQQDSMDCGPACLRIIAKYYGKNYSINKIKSYSSLTKSGVSIVSLSEAAEQIGFRTLGAKIPFSNLKEKKPTPFIAHWNEQHFIVVYKIRKGKVYVSDPAYGLLTYSDDEFIAGWIGKNIEQRQGGIVLMLEPGMKFYESEDTSTKGIEGIFSLFKFFKTYRNFFFQLIVGMSVGSLLQLSFPFLAQSVVDVGIKNQDLGFVQLILLAQLMLLCSRAAVDFIRSWILLYVSTRINISIISDFLSKLMRLPMSFFQTKTVGDLIQRIGDHNRIENFLTNTTIDTIFSGVNVIVFALVLGFYDTSIFFVFIVGTLLYMSWIIIFNKRRRELDYKRFSQLSRNQGSLVQLFTGIQEIKLQNIERRKRWEWEQIQAKLFRINIKSLTLNQYQLVGSFFLNEVKNILITFIAAQKVIEGQITLGTMLAIQYIIGQLNSPINQLIGVIHAAQDAKISLERLNEVHNEKEEDDSQKIVVLPTSKSISINNVNFQYEGRNSTYVLENISTVIPEGKITAIVGQSGSGKTTLLKLLLKFYEPSSGAINVSNTNLNSINNKVWRNQCGAVLQDGFIFSDTIAKNIVMTDEDIDKEMLNYALGVANIESFINSLAQGLNTVIGEEGHGLSQGQRQRILIARAVYKKPNYLFLDEATNSLDSENEKIIHSNLYNFFRSRTVVVIAHRLSTVKFSDQILVLNNGRISESGTHQSLIDKKGDYFNLIKNQLELEL